MEKLNKKGQSDSLIIPIVIFIFALVVIIWFYILNAFAGLSIVTNNPTANETLNRGFELLQGFDFAIPGLLLGLNLFSVVMLYFLKSHEIMFYVFLIMIPITIFVSAGISNGFEATSTSLGIAAHFPIMVFTLKYLPLIEFIFDIVGGILLLAANR